MAKKATGSPADALLVELLTEELPPKSLLALGTNFADEILNGLVRYQLKLRDFTGRRIFATPRRLATLIPDVLAQGQDRSNEVQGPSVTAPQEAVAGFARKNGVSVEALVQKDTPRGRVFVARALVKGASLLTVLPEIVSESVQKLPVRKAMRWGSGEALFARPVHGLVMMHGKRAVPGTVLGEAAGSNTAGHRFMGASVIRVSHADDYEAALLKKGSVIADFAARKAEIDTQLQAAARTQSASLGEYQELLDEVTALVEFPAVYLCQFGASFLEIPQECLILTMRQNQKYFPLFTSDGKLLPKFLVVSNMRVKDPRAIVSGNEKVVRPRLEDARFFFDQDRKVRLETRVPDLARVVFHNKLGSQLERVERIQLLAGKIARDIGADPALAERAAWLSKADLLTGMVGEFPELQGTMGRYYALHDGEPSEVADAIGQHYRPRYASDGLPEHPIACSVALADKMDTLAGFFGTGQQPTGDKDPFGLRRSALGVVRIVTERGLRISLHDLINHACAGYKGKVGDAQSALETFVFERFSGYLKDLGFSTLQVDAVLSLKPTRLGEVPKQLAAVKAFQALPEAESLAAANKRIVNILKQAAAKGESFRDIEKDALKEPAEIALLDALHAVSGRAKASFERGDYAGYLKSFAVLKPPVDKFFDSVMVMVDDPLLRRNRLALLADMREQMNRVADISKLAVEK